MRSTIILFCLIGAAICNVVKRDVSDRSEDSLRSLEEDEKDVKKDETERRLELLERVASALKRSEKDDGQVDTPTETEEELEKEEEEALEKEGEEKAEKADEKEVRELEENQYMEDRENPEDEEELQEEERMLAARNSEVEEDEPVEEVVEERVLGEEVPEEEDEEEVAARYMKNEEQNIEDEEEIDERDMEGPAGGKEEGGPEDEDVEETERFVDSPALSQRVYTEDEGDKLERMLEEEETRANEPPKKCTSGQFICENSNCVDLVKDVCNGKNDCGDNSDEAALYCAGADKPNA